MTHSRYKNAPRHSCSSFRGAAPKVPRGSRASMSSGQAFGHALRRRSAERMKALKYTIYIPVTIHCDGFLLIWGGDYQGYILLFG